jgi:hypothetical protein
VCNVRGYCTASVVQHVWALILSLTQHVSGYSQMVRGGSWSHNEALMVQALPIRELSGRTFGVVGWGELGRGTARIAEAFGMRVAIANRRGATAQAGRLELEQLLAISDIVSLHCPLNDLTRGLIGARELSLMKPDALLINTARGALVDGHALGMALKAGRLGGAGIDVLPQEPPLDDEPLLDPRAIAEVVTPFSDPSVSMTTLYRRIHTPAELTNPNVVKVVLDRAGFALYFSRAPIPWVRDSARKVHARHLKHLGLYVFQRDALLEYPTLPQGELERIEQLEQLRWLENGWKIRVAEVAHDAVSVDVPEDVARVEKLLQK